MQVIDGKPYVRPCRSILADGTESNEWIASTSSLYEPLTKSMPLAGAPMLRRARPGGELRIIAALRREAPWMASAIDVIAEQGEMSVWEGRPWLSFRPMLLVGGHGTGKSHFARRLGELSGCGNAVLSFAGVNSDVELAGNPRGVRHPQPCFPACVLQGVGAANPVVVIDEVDKVRTGDMGDPVATLLGMLKRSSAARYFDGCLAAEIDISHVNWVFTANSTARLPAQLLSRLRVIEVPAPAAEHAEVLLSALWQDVSRERRLPPAAAAQLEAAAKMMLLRLFRHTRSVRRLRRAIETLVAVSSRHAPRAVN